MVRIEPGATFGLGDHPTTVLSLRGLRAALPPGGTVLDVGCGSGVLAVTAAVLGAASVTAIDISPGGSRRRHRQRRRPTGWGTGCTSRTTPLAEIDGTFDVVLANLLAPALLDLADDLVRVVAPGGALVISGAAARRATITWSPRSPRCSPVERRTKEGWTAITLTPLTSSGPALGPARRP